MNNKPNFKFSMICLTGGEELTFVPDESIKVKVVSIKDLNNKKENLIEYQGNIYSLSGFVKKFHPNKNNSGAYQGPEYFKFKGKTLNELRKEKEQELKIKKIGVKNISLFDNVANVGKEEPIINDGIKENKFIHTYRKLLNKLIDLYRGVFNKLRNRGNSKIDIYKKIYPEATIRQKKHVAKILNDFGLEHEDYLRAIMESLEAKGGPANYVDYICRYVWTYYPRLFEDKYIGNEQGFKNRINSTLRYYSKNGTTKYSGIEIFVSKGKGTGVYGLKDKK